MSGRKLKRRNRPRVSLVVVRLFRRTFVLAFALRWESVVLRRRWSSPSLVLKCVLIGSRETFPLVRRKVTFPLARLSTLPWQRVVWWRRFRLTLGGWRRRVACRRNRRTMRIIIIVIGVVWFPVRRSLRLLMSRKVLGPLGSNRRSPFGIVVLRV